MLGCIDPTNVDANGERPEFYVTYVSSADEAYVATAEIGGHAATAHTVSGNTITVQARPPAAPLQQAKHRTWASAADLISGVRAALVLLPADTARCRANESIVRAWTRDFEQLGRDLGRAIGKLDERAAKKHR
jgi:hypothetical protein